MDKLLSTERLVRLLVQIEGAMTDIEVSNCNTYEGLQRLSELVREWRSLARMAKAREEI
jgi:hypothetical protein